MSINTNYNYSSSDLKKAEDNFKNKLNDQQSLKNDSSDTDIASEREQRDAMQLALTIEDKIYAKHGPGRIALA